jgi:hypothetical protein
MATLALKPAENFLLVAFIIATNLVIFFNLTSGLIFGEYDIHTGKLQIFAMPNSRFAAFFPVHPEKT